MMDLSPRCYIPSFMKIGLQVLEKKIFEGFLPYMSMAAILVMRPGSFLKNFHLLVPESFHTKFSSEWPSSF